MKLLLSVISSNKNLDRSSQIALNQESASIGRAEDNTLVLFDPKKFISSHHALIEYKDPHYFITDLSANGVLINGDTKPLGKGNSKKLSHGDQIHIGDYTISVILVADNVDPNAVSIESQNSKEIGIFDDPLAEYDFDPIKKTVESDELIQSNSKMEQVLPEDPFGSSVFGKQPTNLNDKGDNTAFEHMPADKEAFQPPSKILVDQPATHPLATNPNDIFSEDWFFDKGNNTEEIDAYWSDHTEKMSLGKVSVSEAEEAILNAKATKTSLSSIKANALNYPTRRSNIHNNQITTPNPVTASSTTDFHNELVQSFLQGAKLENSKLVETITPQTFYVIGTILRASIQGTRDVLEGKAQIKNEMHLDVTLIRPRENNPIKISASTDEALTKLLTSANKAYLSPEKAINEAFDDIRTHHYSLIAGMKSALFAILKRFDPKVLEDRLQKQSLIAANIPVHKQAKLWRLFEELYKSLELEAKDNFYHLFGQAFADTYSQLTNKLKKNNFTGEFDEPDSNQSRQMNESKESILSNVKVGHELSETLIEMPAFNTDEPNVNNDEKNPDISDFEYKPAHKAAFQIVSDPVDCTVFAPPCVNTKIDHSFLVQVFVHLSDQGEAAKIVAKEFDETAERRGYKSLETVIERGSQLTFHLSIPTLKVTNPVQPLTWRGCTDSVQFAVDIPNDVKVGNRNGTVTISQRSVPIGQISFKLKLCMDKDSQQSNITGDAKAYKKAFISYASSDRNEVLNRVQMLPLLNIDFFQDLLGLEPGQRWEREIYHQIDESDVFFLFWSSAAKASQWVMDEVSYAMSRKNGDDSNPPAIIPVIIEGPPPVTPPANLSHLHFNDYLMYLKRPEMMSV